MYWALSVLKLVLFAVQLRLSCNVSCNFQSNRSPFSRLRFGLLPNRSVWMHKLFVVLFSTTVDENYQGYIRAVLLRKILRLPSASVFVSTQLQAPISHLFSSDVLLRAPLPPTELSLMGGQKNTRHQ